MRGTADNCTSIKKKELFPDSYPRFTCVVHLSHSNAENNPTEHMKAETQQFKINICTNVFEEWEKKTIFMEVYIVNIT